MGLEASTCPSMGLSQQGKTAHLQAGWAGLGPSSRSGLAYRRGAESAASTFVGRRAASAPAPCGPPGSGTAFPRFDKPSNKFAERAEYQSRQYFLVIVWGKCFSHS